MELGRFTRRTLFVAAFFLAASGAANADSLVFGFQNPAFSGVGYSAHVLTIENQERTRKQAREDALEADQLAAEREAENTVEARFLRNLESLLTDKNKVGIHLVMSLLNVLPGEFQVILHSETTKLWDRDTITVEDAFKSLNKSLCVFNQYSLSLRC